MAWAMARASWAVGSVSGWLSSSSSEGWVSSLLGGDSWGCFRGGLDMATVEFGRCVVYR